MNKEKLKEIREYISCPQFGDDHYGIWGALRLDQRKKIKDLLDYITKLQEENKRIKTIWKDTNVIIRNDQLIILNTNAFVYLLDLEDKIDKSIDFVDSNIEDEYVWNGLLYHNEVKDELLNILKGSEE